MATRAENSQRQAQRMKAALRQKRSLAAKKNGQRMIPDRVLRKLAALNLPNNPWVYNVCLDALLRGT